jgi:mono/diheme cytochrome c family protein
MHMLRKTTLMYVLLAAFASGSALADDDHDRDHAQANVAPGLALHAVKMVAEGQHTFRFDTFGDEDFWTGTLKLNQAIATVSPATALSVGLKVDVDALPPSLIRALKKGQVDLNSPATTLALLQLNAVIGVTGTVQGNKLTSLGVQCALCHSTVDNSLAPGIGHRLDGWANRDLNIGAIIALAPDLSAVASLLSTDQATVRAVLNSWGPGKFDAELFMDGKAFNGNKSAATLIPPAFGLAGVNLHTWTGWGSVPYWNAFVANLEMHGKGTFFDPRLADPVQFPIAAKAGFDDVRNTPDLITGKLAALQFFQLALDAPPAPRGSFDPAAAKRGQVVFDGPGKCATCHVPPLFTEPGWNMHKPEEIGVDAFQADRAPDHRYRTSPLKGLWTHMKGGFYHDGRFATLNAVVDHYNTTMALGLSPAQENDLVEYLKSL